MQEDHTRHISPRLSARHTRGIQTHRRPHAFPPTLTLCARATMPVRARITSLCTPPTLRLRLRLGLALPHPLPLSPDETDHVSASHTPAAVSTSLALSLALSASPSSCSSDEEKHECSTDGLRRAGKRMRSGVGVGWAAAGEGVRRGGLGRW